MKRTFKAGSKAFADFLQRRLDQISRVSYDRARGLLNRYVRGEADWNQFKHLRQIGLDEISLLKGHCDFAAIVSARDDRGKPVVLAALKGRKKETITDFLKTTPEELARAALGVRE